MKDAYFRQASFNGEADFWGASFNGKASFEEASFNCEASFMDESARFIDAIFNGEANFVRASFKETANFVRAGFKEKAHFEGASFKRAFFDGASLNGGTSFMQASFKVQSSFRKASFKEKADFRGASFNGEMNFRLASFNETVQFYDTTISSKVVDLRLTRYPELQITWSMLEGRLDDIKLRKDITSWQGVYFRLIKNFKNIGDTKSADDAYYHYRYTKYLFCNDWWEKTKWWLEYLYFGLTCGYGVKPLRSLAVAGVLILSFTLSYFIPYFFKVKPLEYRQGKDNADYKNGEKWYHCFYNSFYFSVMTFTTVGYGDYSPKRTFKVVAMMEGILGWLTMALFLVTLANVWLR